MIPEHVVPAALLALALPLVTACSDEPDPAPVLDGPPTMPEVRRRELDELCAWLNETDNPFFGRARLERRLRELADLRAAAAGPAELVAAIQSSAQAHLSLGENAEAVALLEESRELAATLGDVQLAENVLVMLAVAHLRSGETAHCVSDHNPERCLFPIEGDGVWTDHGPADRAIGCLDEALELHPGSERVRWLLNVAHMARGTYPDGLAPDARIDVPRPDPSLAVPAFADVAQALGVDVFDLAGGAVLDDVDGDGLLDMVSTSIDPCGQMRYFHNEGDGTFADWTERAGLLGQLGGLNLNQADYDGDGRLDLFVFRGAWLGLRFGQHRNSLLRQNEDGTFTDVSGPSGVADVARPCATGAWQDYDRDGDLDLYVGGEIAPSQLLRNEGDGTFTDVAEEAAVLNHRLTKGVAWGDYDEDGDPDLYVSNLGGANRLYRNDGEDRFTDVAAELGVSLHGDGYNGHTFACWFFDYDNDGDLDLFVCGFGTGLAGFAQDYLREPSPGEPLHVLRNDGGSFTPVAEELGLRRVHLPMGANYGDVDNDGWLDVYLGTGKPGYEYLVPNALYKNLGGERFVDVTSVARVGHLQKGHGVAFGDVDNDGDQDLMAQMGGFYPDDGFHNAFFENRGPTGGWVTLVLRGRGANRFAVGARVRVDLVRPGGERRSVHALVGSGGSFGGSSLQQELGVGDAEAIEAVLVRWPASGEVQRVEGVAIGAFVEIREGEPEARVLSRPTFELDAR